ncbi:TIGR04540 family protein [Clostridium chrysemydis]|uniref:TIGR04540 family protein n=1 Tax=Clostridium chrysemydis TaxID=2665504 RepID=UPI003F2A1A16
MRKKYKNPKELATCLKDLVDLSLDGIMTFEKAQVKVQAIAEANKETVFNEGKVSYKIATVLGEERTEELNRMLEI